MESHGNNRSGKAFINSFSICTIVSDGQEYALMKDSFEKCNFIEQCEYLLVDNTAGNKMDAYQSIEWFLATAVNEYILIVHQDVRCLDTRDKLSSVLEALEHKDGTWSVCGNAGCSGYKKCYFHLVDPSGKKPSPGLPKKVNSLDENLLIIHAGRKPMLTSGLKGFHLYGTDICINAALAGYSCYVIPFLVQHLSLGDLGNLAQHQLQFLKDYQREAPSRFVQTTCTKFYLGNTPAKTRFFNSPFVFEWVKAWERIKGLFKSA